MKKLVSNKLFWIGAVSGIILYVIIRIILVK